MENTTKGIEKNKVEDKTKEKNIESKENKEVQTTESKQENQKQESKVSDNKAEAKNEQGASKPANKDFLFADGYTMENVTQVAQDYLKSSGHAGECTPIKDNEGIYLGMRVVFY